MYCESKPKTLRTPQIRFVQTSDAVSPDESQVAVRQDPSLRARPGTPARMGVRDLQEQDVARRPRQAS